MLTRVDLSCRGDERIVVLKEKRAADSSRPRKLATTNQEAPKQV